MMVYKRRQPEHRMRRHHARGDEWLGTAGDVLVLITCGLHADGQISVILTSYSSSPTFHI